MVDYFPAPTFPNPLHSWICWKVMKKRERNWAQTELKCKEMISLEKQFLRRNLIIRKSYLLLDNIYMGTRVEIDFFTAF